MLMKWMQVYEYTPITHHISILPCTRALAYTPAHTVYTHIPMACTTTCISFNTSAYHTCPAPTILCISHTPYLGADWSVYEDQQASSDADDEHSLSETTDADHGDFEPDDVSSSEEDVAEMRPRVRERATKLRQACSDWQDQTADALAAMHQMPHGQTCTIKHPEICLLDAVYRLTFLILTNVSNFFLSVSVNTHK
jgi:hypothetical protein